MNKILFIAAISMLLFACEKPETPGGIPGMGDTPGELEVTPFDLPEGFEIVGGISGIEEEPVAALPGVNNLKSAATFYGHSCYGSGGKWIKLKITLKNTTKYYRTFWFPPGLVFEVNSADAQHGILLQWAWICFRPYQEKTFYLDLYCLNKGKDGSSVYTDYIMLGVTKSKYIMELLNHIGFRKINYEFYHSNLKSELVDDPYSEITTNLQDAVWAITNGEGLTDDQIQYIESLPELEPGTYPEGLFDMETEDPPYYFDEYAPVEE